MPKVYSSSGDEINATFSVVPEGDTLAIDYESRGPDRNTDYGAGLELVVERMATYPAIILDALVASTAVEHLQRSERRIEIDGYSYPIDPKLLTDIRRFRIALGSAQARVGREPQATGSGNPTKRIKLVLGFTPGRVPTTSELEVWLSGRARTGVRYWALLVNPRVYGIADAVREHPTDTWTTKGGKLEVGDRAIIWQAKGDGTRRGVVALAEVVEPARMIADSGNPFWRDPAMAETIEERVRVRYVVPPRLPLWLGEPGNEFLEQLSVARGTGGSLFRLTQQQWAQTVQVAGGWDQRPWRPTALDTTNEAQTEESPLRLGGGQGRGLNAVERRVIEDYAMRRAKVYFDQKKVRYDDVHATKPYDLVCQYPDRTVYVEVKGTMTPGTSILVTANEVEHANNNCTNTTLFVVSDIVLDREQHPPVASGGRERIIEQWSPEPKSLKPLTYECSLGKAFGLDVTPKRETAAPGDKQDRRLR